MTFGMYYKTTPVFLSSKTNEKGADGGTDEASETSTGKRDPVASLPKIRVEECGLTVDMKRKREGRGRRQEKVKDPADVSPAKTTSVLRVGGRSETSQDQTPQNAHYRDRRFSDANNDSSGQSATVESSISTEFVDSLRIGKADGRALTRGHALPGPTEPRPVPKMRYSKGSPLNRSIGDAVSTFQTHRAASMGAVSPRERVVIRRLAAKRSEATVVSHDLLQSSSDRNRRSCDRFQRAAWRDRRHHSLEDTRSRLDMVSRKYRRGGSSHGDQYDFHLTYTTSDEMVRELRSKSGADVLGGEILDKTRRSTPGERSGSNGTSDGSSVVHSIDCPMCHFYEPSRFGHVCPPNTPLGQIGKSTVRTHDDLQPT